MKKYFLTIALVVSSLLLMTPFASSATAQKSYAAAAGDLAPANAPKDQTHATMIRTLFNGAPRLAAGPLDPDAYVVVEVQNLKNPGIAYVNWKALGRILKHLGFANPPDHLTPKLENLIFEFAANAMKVKGEDPSAFGTEIRKLYAVRYGGQFLGENFGDGRGASGGYVQTKGVGRTPLVRPWADGDHSSGVVGLPEAIHEALWGALFEEELPLGANPVLFILTTGTKVDPLHPDTSDDRALVVREDMNRPAYYERNTGVFNELMEPTLREKNIRADQKRMEALIPKIARAFPLPQNLPPNSTPVIYLREALNQFIENLAVQYAAAYARQVYHGATSTSNIVIDGRFLDFGTSTAVRGYGKLRMLAIDGPNGETTNLKSDLVFEMFDDLRRELPDSLKSSVPNNREAGILVDRLFRKHLLEQFLILAGTPKELAPEACATREGKEFATALVKIAQQGNGKVLDWTEEQERPIAGTYNLGQVLQKLIKNLGFAGLAVTHTESPPPPMKMADWAMFNSQGAKYYETLMTIAARHHIAPAVLARAVTMGVKARNTTMEEARSVASMWENFKQQAKIFSSGQNKFVIQNLIDGIVERSAHEFKTSAYKIEVAGPRNTVDGQREHRILNLQTGREEVTHDELPGFRAAREFARGMPPEEERKLDKNLKYVLSCVKLLLF